MLLFSGENGPMKKVQGLVAVLSLNIFISACGPMPGVERKPTKAKPRTGAPTNVGKANSNPGTSSNPIPGRDHRHFSGNLGVCKFYGSPYQDSHLQCAQRSYTAASVADPHDALASDFRTYCSEQGGAFYTLLTCERRQIHGSCDTRDTSNQHGAEVKQTLLYSLENGNLWSRYSFSEIKGMMDEKNLHCLDNGGAFTYNLPEPEPAPQPTPQSTPRATPLPSHRPQSSEYRRPLPNSSSLRAEFQRAKTEFCNMIDLVDVASTTEAQIRSAYRRKALKMHPDRNPSINATGEFQALRALKDRYDDLYYQYQSNW